jgi:succinylglutamate desuccinylase
MDLLCFPCSRIFFRSLGVRRALEVDLHFTIANDGLSIFLVLAALRVNRVVTLSGLPKDSDLYVLHQARRLILEIRGFQRFDGEDFLVAFHL